MNAQEAFSIRDAWYSNLQVKYEMIKFLKNREFALIPPKCFAGYKSLNYNQFEEIPMSKCAIRQLRCHNTQSMEYILEKKLNWKKRRVLYNMYYSIAHFVNGVPPSPPGPNLFKDHTWTERYIKEMNAYDLFIDVDAGDHNDMDEAKYGMSLVVKILDSFNVPYQLRFSGMGYHAVVPYDYFVSLGLSLNPNAEVNIYQLYVEIVKKLHDKLTELIDTSVIDSRRVAKIPYSLAFYEDGAFICWPFLDKEEFNHHHYTDYDFHEWTPDDVYNRGSFTFNAQHNYTPETLLEGIEVNGPWQKKE